MRSLLLSAIALAVLCAPVFAAGDRPTTRPSSVLGFTVTDIKGKAVSLADYRGKVLLIVNVASRCGNTPQYAALEAAYRKYKDQGLLVLGFPANEFGAQEPGNNDQILAFCRSTYDVTFPMFAKIIVKGDGQAPLYQFLTSPDTDPRFAGPIQWNFAKFLVDRDGAVVDRFAPGVKPDSPEVTAAIERELAKQATPNAAEAKR